MTTNHPHAAHRVRTTRARFPLAIAALLAAALPMLSGVSLPSKGEILPPDNTSTTTVGLEYQPRLKTSDPATWHRVPFAVDVPVRGITPGEGTYFRKAMEVNTQYLLTKFSPDHVLYHFRVRAGVPDPKGKKTQVRFWDTELRASNAGRFLMGAGNTLRWLPDPKLQTFLDTVLDGIEACREPNGYILPHPADKPIAEEPNYARAWLTHGLIDAAIAGHPKALPLLRGHADWFNTWDAFHPKLLHWNSNNHQGHIASTRTYFTPVGKAEDLLVAEKFYVCDWWLDALAKRNPDAIWKYPLQNPHSYLITSFEAYLDHYLATGDETYLRAVEGAWDMIHDLWEHVGGNIAVCETKWVFDKKKNKWQISGPAEGHAPSSYYLSKKGHTGETCGSVFWVKLNQRFHRLRPDDERYVSEIEKSIYNVILANQQSDGKNRYHAVMEGKKDRWGEAQNSCCEGQGTRAYGSLPEYAFSIAKDGLYVNLYEAATFTGKIAGKQLALDLQSGFPRSPEVALKLSLPEGPNKIKLRVRVPSWALAPMALTLDGKTLATGTPGSYVTLDREWKNGDTVKFVLPLGLRATKYRGIDEIAGKERYALEYGPLLLGCSDGKKVPAEIQLSGASSLVESVDKTPDANFIFHVKDSAVIFKPYFLIGGERFTTFPIVEAASGK
ncbi:MAG: glycoside hydrolase family 127 protein [Puniceicoccales bacterium]|jgi:hypothetical protein|nr:glycoside hydrolase family 127 protein [Puniceicoccales bacterium]